MYPRAPLSLVLVVVVASMLMAVPLEAAAAGDHRAPTRRRQLIGSSSGRGIAAVEGMGDREASPFAAFWNQGLVPGQGFPQVGMSAYGYALPGLGLNGFLSPDALILARAGQGDVTNKDLDRIDDSVYGGGGFDRPKDSDGAHAHPDPAYPGCFASERCGASTPIAAAAAAAGEMLAVSQLSLLSAVAVAVALGF